MPELRLTTGVLVSTLNASPYGPTAAYTPNANSLLIVVVCTTGTLSAPSITCSTGVLFDPVRGGGSTTTGFQIFAARSPATAVSQTVTATVGGAPTGCTIHVFEANYLAVSPNVYGAGAIVNQGGSSGGAGTTPTTSGLATTVNPANAVLVFAINATNPATLTPPTGMTEVADTGYATPTYGVEFATADSGHALVGPIVWGGTSATAWGTAMVEITAARGTRPIVADQAVHRSTRW